MNLEQAIRTQLKNDPGVAAVAGTRIFPGTYPQDSALPVVVYQRTAKVPEYTHDGEAGVTESRFQISSFAATFAEVINVANKVRSAFKPWIAFQADVGGLKVIAELENDFYIFNPHEVEHLTTQQILQDWLFLTAGEDD